MTMPYTIVGLYHRSIKANLVLGMAIVVGCLIELMYPILWHQKVEEVGQLLKKYLTVACIHSMPKMWLEDPTF